MFRQKIIFSIFQVKTGFLWFGTRTGLEMYDGRKFIVFKAALNDSTISDDLIRVVFESKDGTLWIGIDNGLNKYIKESSIFIRFLHNTKDRFSICNKMIRKITKDNEESQG
jgi:ligand-binding sensor domain-containing protein